MTQIHDTVASDFGRFLCTGLDAVPQDVLERASTCLVYNAGLGFSVNHAPGTIAANDLTLEVYGEFDRGGATLLNSGRRSSPAGAAFANAVIFGAGGRGDTLGTLHAGQCVIPPVLALIEARGLSADRLLASIVAGYEVGGRLDRAYGESAARVGFRSTALFGGVAAAAASAYLLELQAHEATAAIGIAACMTGGLLQPFEDGSDEPRLQPGRAAELGVLAALAAKSGTLGAARGLDGAHGLIRAAARSEPDRAALTGDLGHEWLIRKVTYKPFPVCAFAQTPVYAGLAARAKVGGAAIERLTIRLNPREATYAGLDFTGPFSTPVEAMMSAPFAVAHGLVRGTPLDMPAILALGRDKAVRSLLSRARLVADPLVPALSAIVEIELVGGERVVHEQMMSDEDYIFDFAAVCAMVQTAIPERLRSSAGPRFERFAAAVSEQRAGPGDVKRFFGADGPSAQAS